MAAPAELHGLTQQEQLDHLRRRIAAVPGRTREHEPDLFDGAPAPAEILDIVDDEVSRAQPAQAAAHRDLPVTPALAELLPHRGLRRGTVTAISGSASMLLSLVATTTAAGGHAAIIGQPHLGLLAAHEQGADLARCARIDDPGVDPAEIAAVLLDGLDLIVLGLGGRSLPPTRARAITARARSKGAALVVTDGAWPGVDLTLDATVAGYAGLEPGHGRVTGIHLDVTVTGRAIRARHGRLDLAADRGTLAWTRPTVGTGALRRAQ